MLGAAARFVLRRALAQLRVSAETPVREVPERDATPARTVRSLGAWDPTTGVVGTRRGHAKEPRAARGAIRVARGSFRHARARRAAPVRGNPARPRCTGARAARRVSPAVARRAAERCASAARSALPAARVALSTVRVPSRPAQAIGPRRGTTVCRVARPAHPRRASRIRAARRPTRLTVARAARRR